MWDKWEIVLYASLFKSTKNILAFNPCDIPNIWAPVPEAVFPADPCISPHQNDSSQTLQWRRPENKQKGDTSIVCGWMMLKVWLATTVGKMDRILKTASNGNHTCKWGSVVQWVVYDL